MKETGAVSYVVFRKTSNAAGGYADFQLKKYDMKEKGAGGYANFQKTRNPTNHVNDIFARTAIDAGGHVNFLNANTIENENTISDTTAPAPAPLAETKALTEKKLREGVLNGSILSAVSDTACTSNAGMVGDPFIQTGHPATKIFTVADGHKTPGSTEAKLHHPVMEPAQTVDMVPALVDQSLLSGNKFSQAGYVTIYKYQAK